MSFFLFILLLGCDADLVMVKGLNVLQMILRAVPVVA